MKQYEEVKVNKHMVFFPEYYEVKAIIGYSGEFPIFNYDIAETYSIKVDFQYLDEAIEEIEDYDCEVDYIEYIVYDQTEKHGNKGVIYEGLSYDEALVYDDLLTTLWYAKDALTEANDYDIH